MPIVKLRDNDSFDAALRRFKRLCEKAGISTQLRKTEFHEKPTDKRKRKRMAAVKRDEKRRRKITETLERGRVRRNKPIIIANLSEPTQHDD